MRILRNWVACLLLFAAGMAIDDSHAQYTHVPDRCPEPCKVGGTHVTPDYQRMTVPFRIKNADNDQYLMVNDRDVSVAPLVDDDHRFLWLIAPGPRPENNPGDTRAITEDNGFEEDILYKLINLEHSMALLRSDGATSMRAAATDDGANQYFLLRKNNSDGSFVIYNPDTTSTATDEAERQSLERAMAQAEDRGNIGGANGVRDLRIKLQNLRGRMEVSIDTPTSTLATMPALMVPSGQNRVEARSGANSGAPGFSWQLDKSPEPLDLARLTIRYVEIFKPSKGHDEDTDWAITGASFALGLVGGWADGKITEMLLEKAARNALEDAAKEGLEVAVKQLAEVTAREAAEEASKRTFKESVKETISNWTEREFQSHIAPRIMRGNMYQRLAGGLTYIVAAPFRAGWWIVKGSVGYVGRTVISVAREEARPFINAAKEIITDRRNISKVIFENEKAIAGWLKDQIQSQVIVPYYQGLIGEDTQKVFGFAGTTLPQKDLEERHGHLGGKLGKLKEEFDDLKRKWGGDARHFRDLARTIAEKIKQIDPNVAYITKYTDLPAFLPLNYDPTAREMAYRPRNWESPYTSGAYEYYLKSVPNPNATPPNRVREYFSLDYVPEQTIYKELFSGGEEIAEYERYLEVLKRERATVELAKRWRPIELKWIRESRGWTERQAELELRKLRKQLIDAENKEFQLRSIATRITEIELFKSLVEDSPNPALALGDPRVATYQRRFDIPKATYDKCKTTKVFAVPEYNGPYGRLASEQAEHEMAGLIKTISGIAEGNVTGMDAALLVFMAQIDGWGFGTMAEELKKLSELSDDQLEIFINSRQVWPYGGSGFRNMGKDNRRDRVDVEYIFERGDIVNIGLVEQDVGDDDDLGSLKVHTRHLFDREIYDRVYIQSDSEGSLYAVDLVLEPFYAPTPDERARERTHQRDCVEFLRQIQAEEFAYNVEKTRIDGRLALMEKWGANAVKLFDRNAWWANEACPGDYSASPRGEWRVGRLKANGGYDRDVTWTTTFAPIQDWGKDGLDWSTGEGIIVTPSETGIWNTRNWSSMYFVQDRENGAERDINGDWVERTDWSQPRLSFHFGDTDRGSEHIAPVKFSDESCEIYALMYGSDGMLGSLGRKFVHPEILRERQREIEERINNDPEVIAEREKVEKLFENDEDGPDPYRFERQKEFRNFIANKRRKLEQDQRDAQRETIYHAVENERVFALRSGERIGLNMFALRDRRSRAAKAVQYLNGYYSVLPESRAFVNANLRLNASGPAGLWMEKISDTPGGTAEQVNIRETSAVVDHVKQALTGSWSITPIAKRESFFWDKRAPESAETSRWIFTPGGSFVSQPAHDFWFTPPIEGTWKYIGDQRIEVTTKVPVRIDVAPEDRQNSETQFHDLGTSFIVKMQQKRRTPLYGNGYRSENPTEFDGFFVQGPDGQRILRSEQLHPGKTPFDVPDQYSQSFFDLFIKASQRDGSPVPETFLKQAESNKAAMAAKLAELELLHSESPCTREYLAPTLYPDPWERSDPGYLALHGKWRVGQYGPGGEKQYLWNYKLDRAPHEFHSEDKWRELGVRFGKYRPLKDWRTDDFHLADDPRRAFERPAEVWNRGYQQEWHFREPEQGYYSSPGITISTWLDGGYSDYKDGDIAPRSARREDLVVDPETGEFKIKLQEAYSPYVHENGLRLQKIVIGEDIEAKVEDDGCRSSSRVGLPKLTGDEGHDYYNINFIYHENGDKEFYLLKPDGTLFLWGLQDADRTKYKYEYDQKIIPVAELGYLCTQDLDSTYFEDDEEFPSQKIRHEAGYDFPSKERVIEDGKDVERDRDPHSFELENYSLETLRIIRKAGAEETARYAYDLEPGGFLRIPDAAEGEKISVLTEAKRCYGQYVNERYGTKFRIGKGFTPPQPIHTDAETTLAACENRVVANREPGRWSNVKVTNSGTTTLTLYRLSADSELANDDGEVPPRNEEIYDPGRGRSWYVHLGWPMTIGPGETRELPTRIGHAYKAIRPSDQLQRDIYYRSTGLEKRKTFVGPPEICFGQFKVSETYETIEINATTTADDAFTSIGDYSAMPSEILYLSPFQDANGCEQTSRSVGYKSNQEGLDGWHSGRSNRYGEVFDKRQRDLRIGAVANSGSETIYGHWVDYGGSINRYYPTVTVRPGETRLIRDFWGAKYRFLTADGKCVGQFDLKLMGTDEIGDDPVFSAWNPSRATFGDGSTQVNPKELIDGPTGEGIPRAQLSETQIKNGCEAFGTLASNPTDTDFNDYDINKHYSMINRGNLPLTVHWISMYGARENSEHEREPKAEIVQPGETHFLGKLRNSIFEVTEPDGTCVAVIKTEWTRPYELKDRQSIIDEANVVKFEEERNDKLADLKRRYEAQAESACWPKTRVDYRTDEVADGDADPRVAEGVYAGNWDVQVYPVDDSNLKDGPELQKWSFTPGSRVGDLGEIHRSYSDGTKRYRHPWTIRKDIADPDSLGLNLRTYYYCKFRSDSHYANKTDTFFGHSALANIILNPDGSKEFFMEHPRGKLRYWGVKTAEIGAIADLDERPDAVAEHATRGTPVGVTARVNNQAEVTYNIDSNTNVFVIDPRTGEVTAYNVDDVDREKVSTLDLRVIASLPDGSQTSKWFEIAVTDVNEFDVSEVRRSRGQLSVSESAEIGRKILQVQAYDADADDTVSSYRLTRNPGDAFAIDWRGWISVAAALDTETRHEHAIEVTATSSDGSSSSRVFPIKIENVNEFFVGDVRDTDPRPNELDEGSPIGSPVGITVSARDGDYGDTVTYEMLDLVSNRDFTVDPNSGVVTTTGKLDLERGTQESQTILVRAKSSDGFIADMEFTFTVKAVNEFDIGEMAILRKGQNPGVIDETAPAGTAVGLEAWAFDKDFGDTHSFALVDDADGQYAIDADTGVITVARSLDRDKAVNRYDEIWVAARSSDGSVSRKRERITVNLVSEFGISNVIDSDPQPNVIDEGVTGYVGITASAEDRDLGDTVSYALEIDASGGDQQRQQVEGLFRIDSQGQVRVDGVLDYETIKAITGTITATSSDESQTSMPFTVRINDVNEHQIDQVVDADRSPNTVKENAPIGTPVGITAKADDLDPADTVSYRMIDDVGGRFAVDSRTGVVTVAGSLDLDVPNPEREFRVQVEAMSSDGSRSESSVWIPIHATEEEKREFRIDVTEVDEFPLTPIVDLDNRPDSVDEDATEGTEIGIQVSASDGDQMEAPSYRILEVTGVHDDGNYTEPFRISNDGVITVWDSSLIRSYLSTQATIKVLAYSHTGGMEALQVDRREETFVVEIRPAPRVEEPETPTVDDTPVEDDSPTFVNWYSDPQDPRGSNDYSGVSDDDWNQCIAANEDPTSPRFNNEKMFYDCADRKLADAGSDKPNTGLTADQLANGCGEYGQLASENRDGGAMVIINNTGSVKLNIFIIDETGADVDYSGQNIPLHEIEVGDTIRQEAQRGTIFSALDEAGNCVGIAKTPESRNEYSFGTDGSLSTTVVAENPVDNDKNSDESEEQFVNWYENPQDPRSNKDYGPIDAAQWDACVAKNEDPNSADFNSERAFYDCLDIAIAEAVGSPDLNPGGAYAVLPEDVLQTCQGDIDCLDTAVLQLDRTNAQGTLNRLESEFPTATQENLDACERSHGWGSDDFFSCLDQTVLASNDGGPENQEPGWDRETVFFEPAYDYCVNKLKLDDQSEEYGTCYYAYDHRLGRVPDNDNAPTSYADASCRERDTRVSEYLESQALVTVQNEGDTDLVVYWISYEGEPVDYDGDREPLATVAPGQSEEIDAYRGFVFLVTDMRGDCLGLIEAKESRNGKSFSPGGNRTTSDGQGNASGEAEVTQWYDNPQDPRNSKDYSAVLADDWEICYAANEDVNSSEFNNESAFWNCMDTALARTGRQGAENDNQTLAQGPGTCMGNGEVSEYEDREALVSIRNEGASTLYVYWIDYEGNEGDYDGTTAPLLTIEAGQTEEITAFRGFVFSVLDESGNCLGLAQTRESRNSYSFTPGSGDQANFRRNAG